MLGRAGGIGIGRAGGARGAGGCGLLALNFTSNNASNKKAYSKVVLSSLFSYNNIIFTLFRYSSLLDPSKASNNSLLSSSAIVSSRHLILVSIIYIYKTYDLSYRNYL